MKFFLFRRKIKQKCVKKNKKMGDTLDNLELLLQLGMKVGEDWCILGRFLSVKDHKLDVIDVEYNDLKEKAQRMLWPWKNQQKYPTLGALANAIYKIKRADLIRVLEKFSSKKLNFLTHLK